MASSVAQIPPGDLFSPVTADRRIQSQILDQWATRQAREMITTIERRSHEAELYALSNVRASSLIQMWREMESVAYPRGVGFSLTAEKVSGGSDAESEKERRGLGKLVKKMSLKISSWPSSSSDESEFSGTGKEQLENQANVKVVRVRVRGRKEMEDLVMRMKQERLRQLAELADEQKVSQFPFRGRIQTLIRLRDLRQQVSTIKHQQEQLKKSEGEESQRRPNSICLRKVAEDISQQNGNEIQTEEDRIDSQDSHFDDFVNHSENDDTQCIDLISTIELEGSSQAFFTSLSREEDLQESRIYDALWKQPDDSSVLKSYQGEILMEETKASTGYKQQTFINNVEVRELLERKTVTNFLASDFSQKLNQLIMSFTQKQALQYANKNGRDGCEEETIWRQNYEDCSDPDPSASFNQNSSASEQDEEVINDLRYGLAQIQSEVSELRKMVESCLEWQKKIECSIKQEFSSAVNQLGKSLHLAQSQKKVFVSTSYVMHLYIFVNAVERGKSSLDTKWNTTCSICCEDQVDTVLYRCGHMCACFKCSQALQWSSSNCPICYSTIVDVVRVYPNI
ncbi:hypothetical protein IEQ34_001280 [Dendrobium chrysotoxum]|uniref:RING-type domain-containing protein n=1 Tax=Dendrobium chrysotoxum TaxID=161865 RepID=A0AAV7HLF8_DENCH|nr:hypothetical protein IEQ34_001280 [Dendrobium chrysotoxum]